MSNIEIRQFPCLKDSLGFLIHDPASGTTIAIDVPETSAYQSALEETGWTLTHILITHHHWAQVVGLSALKEATGAYVLGPALSKEKVPDVDQTVEDGEKLVFGDLKIQAIDTPGHTLDHLCWYFPNEKVAHTGDTLLAMGCGPIVEGDAKMMWGSLVKLVKTLSPETTVYCSHEHTVANGRFAKTVDTENPNLETRITHVNTLRAKGKMTLPTTMTMELKTNPFLRVLDKGVQRYMRMEGLHPQLIFAEVHKRKDKK